MTLGGGREEIQPIVIGGQHLSDTSHEVPVGSEPSPREIFLQFAYYGIQLLDQDRDILDTHYYSA